MSKNRLNKKTRLYIFYNIFLIVLIMLAFLLAQGGELTGRDFSPIVPFEELPVEILIIFLVIAPLSSFLGSIIFGYILSPIFLIVHRIFKKSKNKYGIDERPEAEHSKSVLQAIFPAILAINFALMVSTNHEFIKFILPEADWVEGITSSNYLGAFTISVMFLIGLGMALFVPTWFLLDAGIVYGNTKKNNDLSEPVEINTVGGWYRTILKGYAGIGTIISFYSFALNVITELANSSTEQNHYAIQVLLLMILILGLPFFMMLATIPTQIFLEKTKTRRIKYIRKIANKIGIKDEVKVVLMEISKNEKLNDN
ncbi:MAG: hypothetical protein GF364_16185 [Candidatus Lokiarchaeota archaeon]|nr:hypothetical protein [Candidatus Lokiarchaeota archaeon]